MARTERVKKSEKKLKRILIIVLISIMLIIAIIAIIKSRKKETPPPDTNEPKMVGTQLEDTTYEQMKVTNIELQYLEENNETMVSMLIVNNTGRNVEKERLIATLLDSNGKQLKTTKTYIESLPSGKEYSISIVLKGNLSETKNILLKKDE